MGLIFLLITVFSYIYSLNSIKSKTVGDGQHGTARFATKGEIRKTYKEVPFEVELWRNGKNLPTIQGTLVGQKTIGGKTTALIDDGDVHTLMIGADELKSMPKGQFIVMKTGTNPMISKLKLFFKWGIKFGEKYEVEDKGNRIVKYSDKNELLRAILKKYPIINKKSAEKNYNESPQVHNMPPKNKRAPRNDINK